MSYVIRPFKGKFKVVNTFNGHVMGTHDNQAKAQRQIKHILDGEKKKA